MPDVSGVSDEAVKRVANQIVDGDFGSEVICIVFEDVREALEDELPNLRREWAEERVEAAARGLYEAAREAASSAWPEWADLYETHRLAWRVKARRLLGLESEEG